MRILFAYYNNAAQIPRQISQKFAPVAKKMTGRISARHSLSKSFSRPDVQSGYLRCTLRRRIASEEQRNAPRRRKRHNDIHDTAEDCALSAEHPRNQVKAEYSHKTPVESADDKQHQRQFIYPHFWSTFHIFLRGTFRRYNYVDFPPDYVNRASVQNLP